jgi:spermidine synthase
VPRILAGLVVFVAAAAVLVLEITAARLLAPYVGVTLETYTGIIGVVLAGIALGSWYGGRLADRIDPRRLVGPLLVLGGLLALVAVPLVDAFGASLRGGGRPAVVVLALVGFFLPAAVLSAVSPAVAKLQLRTLAETGQVVGQLSALGTAGALVGTFLTGFLLVSALPTRPIILAVGVGLLLVGAALWLMLRAPGRGALLAVVALAALPAGLTAALDDGCDAATAYYCARVDLDDERPSGRVLVLDTLRHSYVDLEDPEHLEFRYTRIFASVVAARFPPAQPLQALHLGGGGFTMPRYLAATRPGSRSVVLELDQALVDLGRRRLGVGEIPALRIETGDARLSIEEEPAGRYDVAFGDAFGGLAVPWHLTTEEFVRSVRARLRPGGVYVLNVIDYPPLRFGRAEVATLRRVFRHVAAVVPPGAEERADGGNLVLVASDAAIDAGAIEAVRRGAGGSEVVLAGERLDRFVDGQDPLRDDYAPVDQLLTPLG